MKETVTWGCIHFLNCILYTILVCVQYLYITSYILMSSFWGKNRVLSDFNIIKANYVLSFQFFLCLITMTTSFLCRQDTFNCYFILYVSPVSVTRFQVWRNHMLALLPHKISHPCIVPYGVLRTFTSMITFSTHDREAGRYNYLAEMRKQAQRS